MKAIIMAGGEGQRLRPLTCDLPKPMIPVMGRPVIEHIINLLKEHGITQIGITLMYLPHALRSWLGDGERFGVSLTYFTEKTPLGTAGCVKAAEEFLDDDFLVISGDSLTDMNLSEAISFHRQRNADATLVLKSIDVPLEYGVVITSADGRIERFVEKPDWSRVFSDTVNTGTYIFKRDILDEIPSGEPFDFSCDLFPKLLKKGAGVYGTVTDGYWCDIGDLSVYRACHNDIFDNRVKLKLNAEEVQPGIFLEDGAIIDEGAVLSPPVYIGARSRVMRGASVEGYSVIGKNCALHSKCSVKRSVVSDGCHIGKNAQLRGCVLSDKVSLSDNVSVFEGAVIGRDCAVQSGAVIKPDVKIWPAKTIDEGATVSANLVWGTHRTSRLFGYKGITGELGADITPEFAARLGSAFGSIVLAGKIAVSADESEGAQMLKTALASGLAAVGCEVYDLKNSLLPVLRSAVKFYELDGGVHVQTDNDTVIISLADSSGADLSKSFEKRVQTVFLREDFSFASPERIKPVCNLTEYNLYYMQSLKNGAGKACAGKKILLSAPPGLGQRLIADTLSSVGCTTVAEDSSFDLTALSQAVTENGCDFGAVIDKSFETLTLIDRFGHVAQGEFYFLLCALVLQKKFPGCKIFAPVSMPTAVERICERFSGQVVRTEDSSQSLMHAMQTDEPSAKLQFKLCFDAPGALFEYLDFLAANDCDLSELFDEIPAFYLTRREVECAYYDKGRVMKSMTRANRAQPAETTDGIKLSDDGGWVLILPDPIRPVVKVIAEGYNAEYASELTDIYAEKVRKITEG